MIHHEGWEPDAERILPRRGHAMPEPVDRRIRNACARLAAVVGAGPLADLFTLLADAATTGPQAAEAFERAAGELGRESVQAP